MKKTILAILGVLAAYITAMLLSTATTLTLRSFFDVASAENPPFYYQVFDLLYGILYIGVGAYVGTWIAKTKLAYIIMGALFVTLGIVMLATGFDAIHPVWYQVASILLTFPAVYIGGHAKLKNMTPNNQRAPAVSYTGYNDNKS